MILRCALLCLILQYGNTSDVEAYLDSGYENNLYEDTLSIGIQKRDTESLPPEPHTLQANKNEAKTSLNSDQSALSLGLSEGGVVKQDAPVVQPNQQITINTNDQSHKPVQINTSHAENSKIDPTKGSETIIAQPIQKLNDSQKTPVTLNETAATTDTIDLNSPGVVKRALIVFGGLTLLAVAYIIFYRNKHKKFDAGNVHNTNDSNQFRYGVLNSEDRRENLELSRIPLTMESDDDDDEDLEIFDLEQKRKSLSYSNLPGNDEDIVLRSSKDESKNNLLLDIEDGPSDTLINWSSSESKSIL